MSKYLRAFSPPRQGYDAWHPCRIVVAELQPHTIDRSFAMFLVVRSSHPDFVQGKHYRRCVYQAEDVYVEDGVYYRDCNDEVLVFE